MPSLGILKAAAIAALGTGFCLSANLDLTDAVSQEETRREAAGQSPLASLPEPYRSIATDARNWIDDTASAVDTAYATAFKKAVDAPSAFVRFSRDVQLPLQYRSARYGSINYLATLPLDFAEESSKRYPLVIDLHGFGLVGQTLVYAPVSLKPPFSEIIFVSPVCNSFLGWNVRQLDELLDHLLEIFPVDEQRICLMGHSLGGNAVWRWASERPDRFAALSPWSGWGNPREVRDLLRVPIKILHGVNDSIVSPQRHLRLAEALIQVGGKVSIEILDDRGHWIDEMYLRTRIVKWLVSHRRSASFANAAEDS